ncbi:metallophosphoesterase family protein [Piscirickettsia litoralis]|uniref:Calcineurin-like phosphoesterase domain-containing protein n=1 Tax=Piscirickettsia litoralis TaxID=1891921 RepID=A0ABX2ZZ83_9GAMM|nr:hypothetical protein [Piscirickettsia litoralis]ODN41882.1 hypothetical protein BGC07_01500 [Piscirickettsia litoralis]
MAFYFLDSNSPNPGDDAGFLSLSEQNKLKQYLSEQHRNIVVVHHHPIAVSTPIIDHYIMKNGDTLTQHQNIDMILVGHVHGDYTVQHDNFTLESGIATCLQWEKGAREIAFDLRFGYTEYLFTPTHYQKRVHWIN